MTGKTNLFFASLLLATNGNLILLNHQLFPILVLTSFISVLHNSMYPITRDNLAKTWGYKLGRPGGLIRNLSFCRAS